MSAQQLITTEPRTEPPHSETERVTERPPTARVQRTFRYTDRSRLRNLIDEWNAFVAGKRVDET